MQRTRGDLIADDESHGFAYVDAVAQPDWRQRNPIDTDELVPADRDADRVTHRQPRPVTDAGGSDCLRANW